MNTPQNSANMRLRSTMEPALKPTKVPQVNCETPVKPSNPNRSTVKPTSRGYHANTKCNDTQNLKADELPDGDQPPRLGVKR